MEPVMSFAHSKPYQPTMLKTMRHISNNTWIIPHRLAGVESSLAAGVIKPLKKITFINMHREGISRIFLQPQQFSANSL